MQTLVECDNVLERILTVLSTIRKIYEESPNIILKYSHKDLQIQTRLQFIFNLKFSNKIEAIIFESILHYALDAEKLSPGSFDVCLETIFKNNLTVTSILSLKKNLDELKNTKPITATGSDLQTCIFDKIDDKNLRNVIQTAMNLSGFGNQIMIEKSKSDLISIELVSGYTYNLSPVFKIIQKFDHPKIICIDGFIETVSEINLLLDSAFSTKIPVIIFSRGMSDDVIHTLKVNYDRNSLNVIPIIVPFDFEGINTINDIAIICGCDIISTNKGDLISSVSIDDLKFIQKISIFENKIQLFNKQTKQNVFYQVEKLKKKRFESSDQTLISLLNKRIKALSSNQVVIRFPDNDHFIINSQQVDYALRSLKSLINYGVKDNEPFAKKIIGMHYAYKCIKLLSNVGSIIKF